jgi:hypothetical protein
MRSPRAWHQPRPIALRPAFAYHCQLDPQVAEPGLARPALAFTAYALRAGYALTEIFTEDDPQRERTSFKYLIIALNRAHHRGEQPVLLLSALTTLGVTRADRVDRWHTLSGTGADIELLTTPPNAGDLDAAPHPRPEN